MSTATRAAGDAVFMRRAIDLAPRGWGQTAPNPLVGAVVVQDGAIVGEGYHARYGDVHAEVMALRAAGERARGATLYVTLEPCRHHGKTPPCTDAILAAGVRRVVVAALDPTPAGGGAARLRDAGVDVVTGVCDAEARRVDPAFFHAAAHGTPWTTLKLAVSIEGAIAPADGSTVWLTGTESRIAVHRMRAGVDAIAVGVGTVRADDPQLTVRDWPLPRVAPARVVFDARLEIPLDSALVRTARETATIVVGERADGARALSLTAAGVHVIAAASVPAAMRALRDCRAGGHELGIRSVLVEGGARLGVRLLDAGVVQRMAIFQAPISLGSGALHAFAGASPALVQRLEQLAMLERVPVGADLLTMYAIAEQ